MEGILTLASAYIPPTFTVVCLVGYRQATRESRTRRARLFAAGAIVGVLLTFWAWSSFTFPID
jgi:hypothetical protein